MVGKRRDSFFFKPPVFRPKLLNGDGSPLGQFGMIFVLPGPSRVAQGGHLLAPLQLTPKKLGDERNAMATTGEFIDGAGNLLW